jgi:hypothetical protein
VGLASLSVGAGPSQTLFRVGGDLQVRGGPLLWWADRQDPTSTLFTLDDAAEEMEWESIDVGVTSVLEALDNMMGVLCDIVTLAGRVPRDPASWVSSFAFRISNSLLPYSPLWHVVRRNASSSSSRRMSGITSPRRHGCRESWPHSSLPPSRGWRSSCLPPRRRPASGTEKWRPIMMAMKLEGRS